MQRRLWQPPTDGREEEVEFLWMSIDMTDDHIRLFGVTEEGFSVCAFVSGFEPYCYARISDDVTREFMTTLLRNRDIHVKRVEIVDDWKSLMGHSDECQRFAKITVEKPGEIPALRNVLVDQNFAPYESNVPYLLRFMIDGKVTGCQWLRLRSPRKPTKTRCSMEIFCDFGEIRPVEKSKIAPLRILATDIECQGRKGHFPCADHDPVIQISCVVGVMGAAEEISHQTIFTLDTCAPINGARVVCAQSENELLMNWSKYICEVDPDVITGYNTQNFDIPYLLNRAKKLVGFADFGRVVGVPAKMKNTTFSSAQYGKRENVETTVTGRVMFDLLPYMIRNHKLSSYSLNSVCSEFLGQQKEDVHHSIISELQMGNDEDRRRLAVYCLKDSALVIKLVNKLSVLINYVEMARVTGVPLDFLVSRGQQIKVFSMLLRRCRENKLLVPVSPKGGDNVPYEGATVIEPKKAFYETPIATLDFASLYPSIMQAYNLCYSTLIPESRARTMDPSQYEKSPKCADGYYFFVKTKKGLLPQILEDLLAARKQAKKDMKNATDPMEKAVQNGRQLALKVSANSVYGFTGATVGQLPCLPIASAVTAYGRQLLLETKAYVEREYEGAEVVYGDTDSVMIKFGLDEMEDVMKRAEEAASAVSQIFPKPVKLEFEKVYFPYLLMNKKRYAGLLWTNPEKADYLDAKGLETVRRDNCLLVRQLVDACLRKMIIDRNVPAALSHAKKIIGDLLQNKIDISLLVITKSLSKDTDSKEYKAKQAHAELAKKMRVRDPGNAPSVGDRVPYVIVPGPKGAAAFEKAEDPVYVLENNLPIDSQYYLENQLYKPLKRIFEPVVKDTETLLKGDHTRIVRKPTPVARKGGIVMFATKKLKCLGCKNAIPPGSKKKTVCDNCKNKEPIVYAKRLAVVNEHEKSFNKLWTQCQRCQGSLHQDVICTNSDCPIFYKRKKIQADLKDAQADLARFDLQY